MKLDGDSMSGNNWQVGYGYKEQNPKMRKFLEKLVDEKSKEPYVNSYRKKIRKRMAKTV